MWNVLPRAVPWVAASVPLMAAVIPVGQLRLRPGRGAPGTELRNRMATWPGGIWALEMGAYLTFWPEPEGMKEKPLGSSGIPPKSSWRVTGVVQVLAT